MKWNAIIIVAVLLVGVLALGDNVTFSLADDMDECMFEYGGCYSEIDNRCYQPGEILCIGDRPYLCDLSQTDRWRQIDNYEPWDVLNWFPTCDPSDMNTGDECNYVPNINCPQQRDGTAQYIPYGNECKYWCQGNAVAYKECIYGGYWGSIAHYDVVCSGGEECVQSGQNAWCEPIVDCFIDGVEYNKDDNVCSAGKCYKCMDTGNGYIFQKIDDTCPWWCGGDVNPTTTIPSGDCNIGEVRWRCHPSDPQLMQNQECIDGLWATDDWTTVVSPTCAEDEECFYNTATIYGIPTQCRPLGSGDGECDWLDIPCMINQYLQPLYYIVALIAGILAISVSFDFLKGIWGKRSKPAIGMALAIGLGVGYLVLQYFWLGVIGLVILVIIKILGKGLI
jgi:hypothetical protein